VTGGSFEQLRVEVEPSRLATHGLTLSQIAHALGAANSRVQAGDIVDGNTWFDIYTGDFLKSAEEVGELVIATDANRPVYLRDVARIVHGESERTSVVTNSVRQADGRFATDPAVTVAVAKKRGTNGVTVAASILEELDQARGTLIPPDVTVTVSRDYGATAKDKVSHLIMKLFIVSALVTILAYLAMGFRPALIVLITIPVVLLMSLAVAYVFKFTINRVSMFALVFAIGILVDDAIVVVENIYRRWLDSGRTDNRMTAEAVDEVGNPTILATFTVVAALLPMGFVSDMMGPYMLPIPVLSSAAMVFSLLAAFAFVPWIAARLKPKLSALERAADSEHRQSRIIAAVYDTVVGPIMRSRFLGYVTLAAIVFAMLMAVALFPLKAVAFKMLPYDNKSELQVVLNMPEGTDLFATTNLLNRFGAELEKIPEVTAFQTYAGASAPFNFNGLVRHYFMRQSPWQGDIAVQLLDKAERSRTSHDIAMQVRQIVAPLAAAAGAYIVVAEAPPGPPVLAPMVAEIYGPTPETRRKVANDLIGILEKTPDIAEINSYLEAPHQRISFQADRQRASMYGVTIDDINREIRMATGGFEVGPLQSERNLEQAVIVLQVPLETRVNIGNLLALPVRSASGSMVPLGELGRFSLEPVGQPIWHKDLRAVEYVMADVIGPMGAPLYGMLAAESALASYTAPDGVTLGGNFFSRPATTAASGFKWDGEWEVTYVTFRDMGIAFMAALVLIYILVVAEFRSFLLPLIVMAPIPLTLIGIVPGHWMLGADFTATSMIGFIALAGIIVRNSILLVEFARAKVGEGMSVFDAITLAARVRLRPILITALALVIGSMVLLSDPIFQGMAVSLLFGSLVATFLTLVVIPLGCMSAHRYVRPIGPDDEGPASPSEPPPPAPSMPPAPLASGDAPASARPPRLVRKSADTAAIAPAPSPEPAPSGRPPRLIKKGETGTAEPLAPAPDAAVPSGRPPRLLRKSEQLPLTLADESGATAVAPMAADAAEPAPQPKRRRSTRKPRNPKKGDIA
jgi:multidrug efflux pump subunit AcrB